MNTTGRYLADDPARAHVREFVAAVADGGVGGTYGGRAGRYVVGGFATSHVLPAEASRADRTRAALDFAALHGQTPDGGLGYWIDSKTGRLWLDVSHAYNDLDIALWHAQQNGELAIYDREGDREIRVSVVGPRMAE